MVDILRDILLGLWVIFFPSETVIDQQTLHTLLEEVMLMITPQTTNSPGKPARRHCVVTFQGAKTQSQAPVATGLTSPGDQVGMMMIMANIYMALTECQSLF